MPEHLLDRTEIGASFEQMRGERVAQGMGMQILDADDVPRLAHDRVDGLARKPSALLRAPHQPLK